MGEKARPGDGVIGASGRVDGRVVAVFAQDASYAGGSLGEAHAETVVSVLELAERSRVPVIGFVESAGARMQEGLAALSGYAKIFHKHVALSGYVPQISVEYTQQGGLVGQPVLRNPPGDPALRSLAESAMRAVRKCNPMRIPAQFQPFYEQWKARILRFDPTEMSG